MYNSLTGQTQRASLRRHAQKESEVQDAKQQVAEVAGKAKGSLQQLLGIRGASESTNIWKIRLQLTKPVTWVPLIWGEAIVCCQQSSIEASLCGCRALSCQGIAWQQWHAKYPSVLTVDFLSIKYFLLFFANVRGVPSSSSMWQSVWDCRSPLWGSC